MIGNDRPSKDEYFMFIANAVSTRGTCSRRKVGAVLVRDGHIISTGYNGAPEGLGHCIDEGCEVEHGHCVRCVHAEANALIQAGHVGGITSGAILYTTTNPCRRCMALIINARIKRIVYAEHYIDASHEKDENAWSLSVAKKLGIDMVYCPFPSGVITIKTSSIDKARIKECLKNDDRFKKLFNEPV